MSGHSVFVLFASISVFISLIGVSSTEYVPVYFWETTQFSEIVPALERVSQESFRKIVSDRAAKNTPVLIFAEQNLSPEDFILRDADSKTPFAELESLRSSAQISYWPSVKNPIKAVKELSDRTKVEISIKSILGNPEFTIHNNDILIVDLNDARESEDRVQMLKRHDKDVIAVYKRFLEEHKDIITLYTAYHPSWIISEELRSHRRIRDASKPQPAAEEENATDTYKIYNNTDIMIYVSSVATITDNAVVTTLEDYTIETVNKTSEEMVILFKSATNTAITVLFNFKFIPGYWAMTGVVVHNESAAEPKDTNLRAYDVYAPDRFSYHCGGQVFYPFDSKLVYLSLPGFQMQAFVNQSESSVFGDAYDCVGFMSAPIWSGLFVTFILVLIMTFGLTMMMDIKTMDRFDDPKGKTITISATE